METKELRQKNTQELKEMISKLLKELKEAAGNILQKKEKNVKKARQLRREIARIKTLITESEVSK